MDKIEQAIEAIVAGFKTPEIPLAAALDQLRTQTPEHAALLDEAMRIAERQGNPLQLVSRLGRIDILSPWNCIVASLKIGADYYSQLRYATLLDSLTYVLVSIIEASGTPLPTRDASSGAVLLRVADRLEENRLLDRFSPRVRDAFLPVERMSVLLSDNFHRFFTGAAIKAYVTHVRPHRDASGNLGDCAAAIRVAMSEPHNNDPAGDFRTLAWVVMNAQGECRLTTVAADGGIGDGVETDIEMRAVEALLELGLVCIPVSEQESFQADRFPDLRDEILDKLRIAFDRGRSHKLRHEAISLSALAFSEAVKPVVAAIERLRTRARELAGPRSVADLLSVRLQKPEPRRCKSLADFLKGSMEPSPLFIAAGRDQFTLRQDPDSPRILLGDGDSRASSVSFDPTDCEAMTLRVLDLVGEALDPKPAGHAPRV